MADPLANGGQVADETQHDGAAAHLTGAVRTDPRKVLKEAQAQAVHIALPELLGIQVSAPAQPSAAQDGKAKAAGEERHLAQRQAGLRSDHLIEAVLDQHGRGDGHAGLCDAVGNEIGKAQPASTGEDRGERHGGPACRGLS